MPIPKYNEVDTNKIFPPGKYIKSFVIALVNDLIDKLNGFTPGSDLSDSVVVADPSGESKTLGEWTEEIAQLETTYQPLVADLWQFTNELGFVQFEIESVGDAANNWRTQGALTGQGPVWVVVGSDANIDGNIVAKGTGGLFFGNGSGELFEAVENGGGPTANWVRMRTGVAGNPARVIAVGEANASLDVLPSGTGLVNLGKVSKISFPATQVPSANVNDLDDYEEGTFVPDITFGGAAVGLAYNFRSGGYTKIGNMVSYTFHLALTAKGSSVGALLVSGLPFTASARQAPCSVALTAMAATVGDTSLSAWVIASSATLRVNKQGAGSVVQLTDADFTNTSSININGQYSV